MNLVNNPKIKTLLFERWKELDLKVAEIVNDAAERHMKICPTRLSRYKNGKKLGISEDQLLWLCTRYGIYIHFKIGKPVLVEGKVKYEITPYNELEALTMLKKLFPNG